MSSNLVKIRPATWHFDAIGSVPDVWDGPTFDAEQFEPRTRTVVRGPVQPGGVVVAINDETRLHRGDCYFHLALGAVAAALVFVALGSGMTGSVPGAMMLALFSAWLFRRGWRDLKKMTESALWQGHWIGFYQGRVALRREFDE